MPTLRRELIDMIPWSVGLFRTYPGVLAIVLAFVTINRVPDSPGSIPIPVPLAIGGGLLYAAIYFVGIRALMGTVAAANLADEPVRYRALLRHAIGRMPAILGLFIVVGLVIGTISFLVFIATVPALIWGIFVLALLHEVIGTVAIVAAIPLVLLMIFTIIGPPVYVLFKAWLSIEACVIGNYGPVDSLKVSWRVSTSHRGKLMVIVVSALASSGMLLLVGLLPSVGAATSLIGPPAQFISAGIGELIGITWYAIYAHLYVQGVVDG